MDNNLSSFKYLFSFSTAVAILLAFIPSAQGQEKVQGHELFNNYCAGCHQPQQKSPQNTPENEQILIILQGIPQTYMPSYAEWLNDEQIAAVLNYYKGNTASKPLDVASVAKLRQQAATMPKKIVKKPTKSQSTKPTTPKQAMSKEQAFKLGKEKYLQHCAACHQANGQGMPPTFPPLVGSTIVQGPIAQHIDIVLFGKASTTMVAFKNQLSNTEIAAIISYERQQWGNPRTALISTESVSARKPQ